MFDEPHTHTSDYNKLARVVGGDAEALELADSMLLWKHCAKAEWALAQEYLERVSGAGNEEILTQLFSRDPNVRGNFIGDIPSEWARGHERVYVYV